MKTTLIQHGLGRCAMMLHQAEPYHARYAKHWGILYLPDYDRHCPAQTLFMEKVWLINRVLETAADDELVIWLDADTFIVDPFTDIRIALADNAWLGMVPYTKNPDVFNTGAMWIRPNGNMKMFFAEIEAAGGCTYKDVHHDEGRMAELLDKCPSVAANVQRLDPCWNRSLYTNDGGTKTVIRAWHGQGPNVVAGAMAKTVTKATPEYVKFSNG